MSCRTAFRPSTFFFLTLPPLFLKGVNLLELVSLCRCEGDRFMSCGTVFGLVHFSSWPLPPLFLKGVNLIGLVSLCRRKRGRFMSFRKAFGLVLLSSSPGLLFVTAVYLVGLENIYMSLQVWWIHVIWDGLRPSTLVFLTLSSFLRKAMNVIELVYMSVQGWEVYIF